MHDELGDRMKKQYEDRTRMFLPRRTYTIIRVDGKAFHTFTKGFQRPFDAKLMTMMDNTTIALCQQIQGARLAYVQSDEISVLLTDFANNQTEAFFDGNIQKIVSVSASIATAAFNEQMSDEIKHYCRDNDKPGKTKLAMFDARVFTIPDRTEVLNYFIWRQNDASRNSVQMVAQSLYNHKELQGVGLSALQEKIFQKGKNWNDYTAGEKRGRLIKKVVCEAEGPMDFARRRKWISTEPPIFSQEQQFLRMLVPAHDEKD